MSMTTQEKLETEQIIPRIRIQTYSHIYDQQTKTSVSIAEKEDKPLVTFLDPESLISNATSFLKERLDSLRFESHPFYKIVEVDREPKFVIDILITIPEYNRKRKLAMLSVIGNLMRNYSNLLFDFQISKEKEIPTEYSAI